MNGVERSKLRTQAIDAADVGSDADEIALVCAFATREGRPCVDFEEACRTWLAGVACVNGSVTSSGRRRAKAVFRVIAALLSGERFSKALAAGGLTWAAVTEFRFAAPALNEILDAARNELKKRMGERVLDKAIEVATEGVTRSVYFKGEKVGEEKVIETKTLEKLLALSGEEFQGGRGGGGGAKAVEGPKVVWNINIAAAPPKPQIADAKSAEVIDV